MPASARGAVAALCVLLSAASALAGATQVGSVKWSESDPRFGGLSGLVVDDTGTRLYAVTDKGTLVEGMLTRGPDGNIERVDTVGIRPLLRFTGAVVEGFVSDAEGLHLLPDGNLLISFEGYHRVDRHSVDGAVNGRIPIPDFFETLQNNSSLEALAVDDAGRIYVVPERSGKLDRPFPVYRFDGTAWSTPFALRRDGDFLVVGMDFGPDGHLYLLERVLRGLFFATRVRRFEIEDGARVVSEETLVETMAGTHDNLEGISVWRDGAGKIRITMISDDNFRIFQRTEIVEYRLD